MYGRGRHRPRLDVRRPAVLRGGPGGGREADHRGRGLRRAGLALRPQPGRERGEVPPPHAARPERDRLPQPAEARLGRLPRGLLPPAPHGQAAHGRARRGHHLPVGVPVERGLGAAAERPGRAGPRGRRRVPRHLRRRALLHRGAGPRHRRPAQDPAPPVRPRTRARHPGRGHQRPALHPEGRREAPRRAALHPAAEGADRPEAAEVRLRRVLPEERRGDASTSSPRRPRSATRRSTSPRASSSTSSTATARRPTSATTCRGSRRPAASTATRTCARSSTTGRGERYGEITPEIRERIDHELDVITLDGVRGLLPDRVGPDPLRPRAGHPGRARAGGRRQARW